MAKKPKRFQKLTFVDIVMHADADVIKAAYDEVFLMCRKLLGYIMSINAVSLIFTTIQPEPNVQTKQAYKAELF